VFNKFADILNTAFIPDDVISTVWKRVAEEVFIVRYDCVGPIVVLIFNREVEPFFFLLLGKKLPFAQTVFYQSFLFE
jgi:hypothetical protein